MTAVHCFTRLFGFFAFHLLLASSNTIGTTYTKPMNDIAQTLDVFGPSYAWRSQFWKGLLFSAVFQGVLMGTIALAFFNGYTATSTATWLKGSYQEALEAKPVENGTFDHTILNPLKLGNGKWWYVGMLTGAGFVVGLVKVIWSLTFCEHVFPERIPGFLKDLKDLKADDTWIPLPILGASMLSIGLGASCGPEVALGVTGTATGTVLGRKWRSGYVKAASLETTDPMESTNEVQHGEVNQSTHVQVDERKGFLSSLLPDFSPVLEREMCAIDGMTAAFGAIFPSQLLAVMLILELGGHWDKGGKFNRSETLSRAGVAATFSFALFTSLKGRTLLGNFTLPLAAYDAMPTVEVKHYAQAALLGIVSGLMAFAGLLCLGIIGAIGEKINTSLNHFGMDKLNFPDHVLGKLMTPTIGGMLIGLINVAAPLCLGDGSEQLGTIFSLPSELGATTIAVSGILKFIALGVSIGFGFIGGPVFPFLFAGGCMGTAIHLIVPGVPYLIAIPCCLVAAPAAFVPATLFWTILSSLTFVLGGDLTSAVFIACFSSYTTICGMGIIQDLLTKVAIRKERLAQKSVSQQGLGNMFNQSSTNQRSLDLIASQQKDRVLDQVAVSSAHADERNEIDREQP